MKRHLYWQAVDALGLEHLSLSVSSGGVIADSMILRQAGETPFRARYVVRCDATWRTQAVELLTLGDGGRAMMLRSDTAGSWTDGRGTPMPELAGCVDVDISITPFTNTLPIRRLGLKVGDSADIRVVYVAMPEITVSVEPQRYTRLDANVYEFLSLDGGFTARITVDDEGLALDYPGLFRRVG